MSNDDAKLEAEALGIRYSVLPIEAAFETFSATLAPIFAGRAPDLTEENIQSRSRGVLLMALSNKFGHVVLTTGNKSERSEEHTSELQSLMRISYAVFCLKKTQNNS